MSNVIAKASRMNSEAARLLVVAAAALLASAPAGAQGLPTVGFATPTTVRVWESTGSVTFTVKLSAASGSAVTVQYATQAKTATAPGDFTSVSDTLVIPAGETTGTITVTLTNDDVAEGLEEAEVVLSQPQNATLDGAASVGTFIIYDEDGEIPSIGFSATTYVVGEDAGSATITVELSKAAAYPVVVNYATSNGTATAGSDYTAKSDTLTFAAGETSKTFAVTIANDGTAEGNETVGLNLSQVFGAYYGPNYAATLLILDDDVPPPTVQFAYSSYSSYESAGKATVTVSLSAAFLKTVKVNYTVTGAQETPPFFAPGYEGEHGTVTFAPGETGKTVEVTINDNESPNENKSITLTLLSDPENATLGQKKEATLTIADDDWPPTVGFENTVIYVLASKDNPTVVSVPVELSAAVASGVTVTVKTEDGVAKAGGDYQDKTGTLMFDGETVTQAFEVTIEKSSFEGDPKEFYVTLDSANGATIGNRKVRLEIAYQEKDKKGNLVVADYVEINPTMSTAKVIASSPLNEIWNPAGILIIDKDEDKTSLNLPFIWPADVKNTKAPGKPADRAALAWKVINVEADNPEMVEKAVAPRATFYDLAKKEDVEIGTSQLTKPVIGTYGAFLYGKEEGRIKVEVYAADADRKPVGEVLEIYEAFVVKEKVIPFRANVLFGDQGGGTTVDHINKVKDHVRIANVHLRQVGITLKPDENKEKETIAEGAELLDNNLEEEKKQAGFFKATLPTKQVAGVAIKNLINPLSFNARKGVMQINYLGSLESKDLLGYAPFTPGIKDAAGKGDSDYSISLKYRPSVEKTRLMDQKSVSVTIRVGPTSTDPTPPPANPADLWGCVLVSGQLEDTYGQAMAHEVAHALGLLHRGPNAGQDALPENTRNLMHYNKQYTGRDLDIIQLRAITRSIVFEKSPTQ